MSKITVTTTINSGIEKVWQYWNEPQHITRWAFASETWECSSSENDQFFRFESGNGTVEINDSVYQVADGDAVIVPAGARHNIINTGTELLRLYTIYMPPHHQDGIERVTKEMATADAPDFDGKTTE